MLMKMCMTLNAFCLNFHSSYCTLTELHIVRIAHRCRKIFLFFPCLSLIHLFIIIYLLYYYFIIIFLLLFIIIFIIIYYYYSLIISLIIKYFLALYFYMSLLFHCQPPFLFDLKSLSSGRHFVLFIKHIIRF